MKSTAFYRFTFSKLPPLDSKCAVMCIKKLQFLYIKYKNAIELPAANFFGKLILDYFPFS